jgi:hypothetical protein
MNRNGRIGIGSKIWGPTFEYIQIALGLFGWRFRASRPSRPGAGSSWPPPPATPLEGSATCADPPQHLLRPGGTGPVPWGVTGRRSSCRRPVAACPRRESPRGARAASSSCRRSSNFVLRPGADHNCEPPPPPTALIQSIALGMQPFSHRLKATRPAKTAAVQARSLEAPMRQARVMFHHHHRQHHHYRHHRRPSMLIIRISSPNLPALALAN